ncbi:hypothetical protein N7G274_002780 [Stereocaulon virgatum]|uniref:Uncharacterized protein n=1 Tax=Stereocaulon virgatum TaxID=373712 RepID=A0ABR4AGX2_9LECA
MSGPEADMITCPKCNLNHRPSLIDADPSPTLKSDTVSRAMVPKADMTQQKLLIIIQTCLLSQLQGQFSLPLQPMRIHDQAPVRHGSPHGKAFLSSIRSTL